MMFVRGTETLERELEREGRREERARAADHARVAAVREERGAARDDEEVFVLERAELRADAQVDADAVVQPRVSGQLPEHVRAREAQVGEVRDDLELRRDAEVRARVE